MKEIVVATRAATWGFSVTAMGHELAEAVDDDTGDPAGITLRIPGTRGSTYELLEKVETRDEVVYVVGGELASHSSGGQDVGYPLTRMLNEEQGRLVAELGMRSDPWAQGESHAARYAELRARLRARRNA